MDLDRKTAADGREYYRGLRRRRVHESSAGGMQSVDPDGMCWPRGWVMAKVRRRTTRRPSSSCWIPPFRRRGSRGWPVTASITISTTTRTISNILYPSRADEIEELIRAIGRRANDAKAPNQMRAWRTLGRSYITPRMVGFDSMTALLHR